MKLLRLLGKRLRWLNAANTPASAIAYSFVSRFGILAVNVLTGIIVARTLGPVGRGIASATALWPVVVSGLLTLGVPSALRYRIRRNLDDPADLFSSAIIVSVVLGVVALVAGCVFVPFALRHYPPGVIGFARIMMLFAPLMLCNNILQGFYDSQGQFKRSNMMIFVPPTLTLTGLLALILTHRIGPYAVAIVYEAPFALITVVTTFSLRRFVRIPKDLSRHVRTLLHYGLRAYGQSILNVLSGQIDQAMVVGFLSATSFGLYVVAQNGGRLLSVAGDALNTVLFPKASGLDGQGAIALVSRSARLVFASTSLAALGFVALLPLVIPLTYGHQYIPVIGLAQLLTVAVVFGSTTGTFTQAFMATGRPGIATTLQAVGLAITIPLMLALIPRFGLNGIAYAVDLSSILRFTLVIVSYPLFLHHAIPRLVPTGQDLRDIFGRLRRATVL